MAELWRGRPEGLPSSLEQGIGELLYGHAPALFARLFQPDQDDTDHSGVVKCMLALMQPWRGRHVQDWRLFIATHGSFYNTTLHAFFHRAARVSLGTRHLQMTQRHLELLGLVLGALGETLPGLDCTLLAALRLHGPATGSSASGCDPSRLDSHETLAYLRALNKKLHVIARSETAAQGSPTKVLQWLGAHTSYTAPVVNLAASLVQRLAALFDLPTVPDLSLADLSAASPRKREWDPPPYMQPVRTFESAAAVAFSRRFASALNDLLVPQRWVRSESLHEDGHFFLRDGQLHVLLHGELRGVDVEHTAEGLTIDGVNFFRTEVDLVQYFTYMPVVADERGRTCLRLPRDTLMDRLLAHLLPLELRWLGNVRYHFLLPVALALVWLLLQVMDPLALLFGLAIVLAFVSLVRLLSSW